MSYINIKEEFLTPIVDVKVGVEVVYKNGNGNWYKGVILKDISMVKMLLVPPPHNYRSGITVDYGDVKLIQDKEELFLIK